MHPVALARQTAQTHHDLKLVAARLAERLGCDQELADLRKIVPNKKNPALTMLAERRVLIRLLEQIESVLDEPEPEPVQASPDDQPPPSDEPEPDQAEPAPKRSAKR